MAGSGYGGEKAGIVARGVPTLIAAALFAWLARMAPEVEAGGAVAFGIDWLPSLGISLAFRVDGLSLTFGLLITGIGALVTLYAQSYLLGHPHYRRFALYLTAFMLAMLGLVLSDDVIGLFVFWELTSVTSYLLIGFNHDEEDSRRSALQALLVTGMGGLALLAGLLMLSGVAGTYRISGILEQGEAITAHPLYIPILILVLLGAFTKSAQFPFQFWLPNAMAAPTPVSAYLHSATMVKGGVYLMARMHPGLGGTEVWLWTLTIFGGFTALYASVAALSQTDMKQVLAWTTVMALGTLTMLLGDNTGYAATAFATFLVTHALYKAALFMMAGLVDHGTGTRELPLLGGLARAMPITAAIGLLAGLSMAGIPPFVGFIGKELIYAAAEESSASLYVMAGFALGANALMVAAALIVGVRPFWVGRPETPSKPHEGPFAMWVGPLALALLGLAIGLAPWTLQETLMAPTVASVIGDPGETKELKLWAGVNLPFWLSIATFALGGVLYAVHLTLRRIIPERGGLDLDGRWDGFLGGVAGLAKAQTKLLQSGSLHAYLFISFAVLVAVAGAAVLTLPLGDIVPPVPDMTLKAWAVAFLPVAGAVVTVLTHSRITAIAGLGVVGIGIAMLFIVYGAPDVAITQLLVETLVVVLVALAALRLPSLPRDRWGTRRVADGFLAAAVGIATTAAVWAVLTVPLDQSLTTYYELTSWPEAFGRNIVNVILVDFRALDTFGEIAVVLAAALGAYALLRQKKGS